MTNVPSSAGNQIEKDAHTEETVTFREISFTPSLWASLFSSRNHIALSNEFIRLLNQIRTVTWYSVEALERGPINTFIEHFLFYFTHPDFSIPQQHIEIYLIHQPTITNIVALSDFRSTTPWVAKLSTSTANYFKILTLLNPRTEIDIDPDMLFSISDYFSSMWWSFYWLSVPAYCTKETYDRIRRHLHLIETQPFFLFGSPARVSYFPSTYVAPDFDRKVKHTLNECARRAFSDVKIRNAPVRRSIAIATSKWARTAVYTSVGPLIKQLAASYDLTLIHLGKERKDLVDLDIFKNRLSVRMENDRMDCTPLKNNDYAALIYPDIGMSAESVFLSNIRIAPVQCAMYGHPTSTHGSTIDYFIGGKDIEDISLAERHYSERLVLIPGLGLYPVFPSIPRPDSTTPESDEPLRINCPWTAQKITWPLMEMLQEVLRRSNRSICFVLYTGGVAGFNNAMIPFAKDIWSVLGKENVRIMPILTREQYYKEMLQGAFTLDPFPFGGFNTVIDALYLNRPIITLKGDIAYNRFCAGTLELVGLEELITTSGEAFIELILKMIHDESYRHALCEKTSRIDLAAVFSSTQDSSSLCRAIDYLIDNNESLKSENQKTPIVIE